MRAGITLFDTARAYPDNERLLAGVAGRIVTKCGMSRPEGKWVPDGRTSAILDDARESRAVLGRIDLLLLHAPDPRTPLETSVRALARARDAGLADAIGLCNVTRTQLIAAERVTRIDAVQIALGAFDDKAIRGGLVRYCLDRGIEVQAHSPLGGPKRAPRIAREVGVENILALLLSLGVVPIVGTNRPDRFATWASADTIEVDDLVRARFPGLSLRPVQAPIESDREIVMHMGIAGAGKSTAAKHDPDRLNRDLRGGTLKGICRALDERLTSGARHVVLDNTHLTRASRHEVIALAQRHHARVRCVFHDTPLPEAQTNVVLRMLEKYGRLLDPEELAEASETDENLVRPSVLFRMVRDLEPPSADEGFSEIEVVPFARRTRHEGAAIAIAIERLHDAPPPDRPCLLFGWNADRAPAEAFAARYPAADIAICNHPAGPPVCWCRPPLPGLFLAFAERRAIDPHKTVMYAGSSAHEQMARALGITVAK